MHFEDYHHDCVSFSVASCHSELSLHDVGQRGG